MFRSVAATVHVEYNFTDLWYKLLFPSETINRLPYPVCKVSLSFYFKMIVCTFSLINDNFEEKITIARADIDNSDNPNL